MHATWLRRRSAATVLAALSLCSIGAIAQEPARTVHVFVALADNEHQGIVPIPARLGNGLDPPRNLYWGAAAGVKTFFSRSPDWSMVECRPTQRWSVLERCVFVHRSGNVYMIADAYRGEAIRQAIADFLDAAAGAHPESVTIATAKPRTLSIRGGANLLAYVGHDGLMDFRLERVPAGKTGLQRDAIILACASKQYFATALQASGANPLLWTTGLMAPEAYILKAALDGWAAHESGEQVRERAAVAYDRYQHCGLRGARRLFATGW